MSTTGGIALFPKTPVYTSAADACDDCRNDAKSHFLGEASPRGQPDAIPFTLPNDADADPYFATSNS
jgi:hypothetical protein